MKHNKLSARRGLPALFVALAALNVLLVGLSFWQRRSLAELHLLRRQDQQCARLERNRLRHRVAAAERDLAHAAGELARFISDRASERGFPSTELSRKQATTPEAPNHDDRPPVEPTEDGSPRPDIRAIPVLNEEEMAELYVRRDVLPRAISETLLVNGDLDMLLDDPLWNPSGRVPTPEERASIEVKMKDYRFFTRISPRRRLEEAILPEVDLLREDGSYIEVAVDSPPPVTPGVRITHAERSDRAGFYRLYQFFEEDHPDLYHDEMVERQRSIELVVDIYDLINRPQSSETSDHDQ